jgi:hypothetical protein
MGRDKGARLRIGSRAELLKDRNGTPDSRHNYLCCRIRLHPKLIRTTSLAEMASSFSDEAQQSID